MDVDEFAHVVSIGLGRAVLQLQTHNPAPYREALLDACLHDTRYDVQVGSSREKYLFELINLTGEPAYYRDHLLRAFFRTRDDEDYGQIASILAVFAEKGDVAARQCLYDAFVATAAWDTSCLAMLIVDLDGAAGLLFVAERFPIETSVSYAFPEDLVRRASERDGSEVIERSLAEAAKQSPRIAAFLAEAKRSSVVPVAAFELTAEQDQAPDYERVRQLLEGRAFDASASLSRWGLRATETEIERAAADLLAESDVARLRAYLRLFHRRRFPLDPAPLLQLAEIDEDSSTAHLALHALRSVADPRVRTLALKLMASGDGRGAGLLAANYVEGDYQRIEQALLSLPDYDNIHALGFGLLALADAHPSEHALPALLAFYERGPCDLCRKNAIERPDVSATTHLARH